MKKTFALLFALLCAATIQAADGGGSINLQGASIKDALNAYSQFSNLELAVDPAVTNQGKFINFNISASSKKDMLEALQNALHDQANIVITKSDEKHASVSLDKK